MKNELKRKSEEARSLIFSYFNDIPGGTEDIHGKLILEWFPSEAKFELQTPCT
jgi:hypothetical protein